MRKIIYLILVNTFILLFIYSTIYFLKTKGYDLELIFKKEDLNLNIVILSLQIISSFVVLFQLFINKEVIIKLLNGKIINYKERTVNENIVYELVKHMAEDLNIKMPEIVIFKDNDDYGLCFTTGLFKNDSAIFINENIFNIFSIESVDAIIAHEFAHIIYEDASVNFIIQKSLDSLLFTLTLGLSILIKDNKNKSLLFLVLFSFIYLMDIALKFITKFLFSYFSKKSEFRADLFAKRITGSSVPLTEAIKILDVSEKKGILRFVKQMVSSHPTTEQRIKNLTERNL